MIRDQSVDAFTPTRLRHEGVSATVLLFFLLIGLVFWISSLHDRPDFARKTRHREGGARSRRISRSRRERRRNQTS